jgi:tRNA nucleotidyltransferase (CCA-adding enzyme)
MILNLFPKTLTDFFSELEEVGFNFCLVGGAVRDFYIDGKLGHDLDFEVRSENARVSDLKVYLDLKKIKYESLPYEIVRFSILDYDVEITPPRTEKLIEGNTTHHNFNSFIDYNLSYIDSFKRRDLTINAIGLELSFKNKLAIVIDPYNGLVSIK